MPISEERKAELLEEIRRTMSEINRLSAHCGKLMDELEGKQDAYIEARVAAALAALRAKSRQAALKKAQTGAKAK